MNIFNTNYVPLVKLVMIKERFLPYASEKLYTPKRVARMVNRIVEGADREYLIAVSLNEAKEPVGVEIIAIGSMNAAYAEVREIFKHAILTGATGLVLVHNHPSSGDLEPSDSDWHMTERIRQAGELLGIKVFDHIIIGEDGAFVSLLEMERWNESKAA